MNKDPKVLAILAVGGIAVLLGGTWLLGKILHKGDPDPIAYEEDLPPVLDYDLDFEVPTDLDPTPIDPTPEDPSPTHPTADPVAPDPAIAANPTSPATPTPPTDPVAPVDPAVATTPPTSTTPPSPDPARPTDPGPASPASTTPSTPLATNNPPAPTPGTPNSTPTTPTPAQPASPATGLPPVASNPPPATNNSPPTRPADPVRPSPDRPDSNRPPEPSPDRTATIPSPDPIKPAPVRPSTPRPAVLLQMADVETAPGTARGTLLKRSRYLVSIDQMNSFRTVENIPARAATDDDSNIATATWEEAVAFTAWLTQAHRQAGLINADAHYRLPTTRETRSTTIWRHDDRPTHSNTRRPVGIVLAKGAKP